MFKAQILYEALLYGMYVISGWGCLKLTAKWLPPPKPAPPATAAAPAAEVAAGALGDGWGLLTA